jgi:hypothetical protein
MFKKTGLDAAMHYFSDNLTDAYRQRDPHGWNISHGLYFLAESLKEIEKRIDTLEKTTSKNNP